MDGQSQSEINFTVICLANEKFENHEIQIVYP